MEECFVDIGAPLIANRQPPKACQPGQRPLDDPAIAAQAFAALDALARDAYLDVALRQRPAATRDVIGLVGMDLLRSLAGSSARPFDRPDGIQQRFKVDAVMAISGPQQDRQRDALTIDYQMAFATRFPFVCRVRADDFAPLFAGIEALSRLARDQSI